MQRKFRPLISGDLELRARDTVNDIAEALLAAGPSGDHSLGSGNAGIGVFLEHLSISNGAVSQSGRFMEPALAALETEATDASLFGGFTGIAWAQRHIESLHERRTTQFDEVHLALKNYVRDAKTPSWDLITGFIGIGLHALEDLQLKESRMCLEVLVSRLVAALDEGVEAAWLLLAKPGVNPPQVDLGVAHGLPGLIAFLSHVQRAGVLPELVGPLITRAVTWLFGTRRGPGMRLPYSEGGSEWARDAWCYGDPGVSLALLAAARALAVPEWEVAATTHAAAAAARPASDSGVLDAGLCHGAAGLAHMFHRLYRLTARGEFRTASVQWLVRTLDFPRVGARTEGIAGYFAVRRSPSRELIREAAPGLLSGVSGIGLALLSAIADRPLAWDRVLLLP